MAQHSFYLQPPRINVKRADMKLILIPRSTAFMRFILQKQCDFVNSLCNRHTLHATKGAHHRGFQFAE